MSFLPSVIRAEYRSGFRIHLTFNDNSENTIDFRQWLDGPIFEPLRDPAYFRGFFLDGGTVVWSNGADIAPETLYEHPGRRPNKVLRPPSRNRASRKTQRRAPAARG